MVVGTSLSSSPLHVIPRHPTPFHSTPAPNPSNPRDIRLIPTLGKIFADSLRLPNVESRPSSTSRSSRRPFADAPQDPRPSSQMAGLCQANTQETPKAGSMRHPSSFRTHSTAYCLSKDTKENISSSSQTQPHQTQTQNTASTRTTTCENSTNTNCNPSGGGADPT